MSTPVIHETYLPFTPEQLGAHFAEVVGKPRLPADYVRYYAASAERHLAWKAAVPRQRAGKLDVQVEKDERFWTVTALMSLFHGGSWATDLAALLEHAFPDGCPFDGLDWSGAFGADTELYFEVNMPSPQGYRDWLRGRLSERVLVPEALKTAGTTTKLEGSTKVDAVVVSPTTHAAVAFEAKVLSDVSTTVTFDATRNQLARLVDVTLDPNPRLRQKALEERRPDRTCVVLLTPEIFKAHRNTRFYGHLHDIYRSAPSALAEHLPHRTPGMIAAAARRIGWTTWEDVEHVRPGSLPWKAARD